MASAKNSSRRSGSAKRSAKRRSSSSASSTTTGVDGAGIALGGGELLPGSAGDRGGPAPRGRPGGCAGSAPGPEAGPSRPRARGERGRRRGAVRARGSEPRERRPPSRRWPPRGSGSRARSPAGRDRAGASAARTSGPRAPTSPPRETARGPARSADRDRRPGSSSRAGWPDPTRAPRPRAGDRARPASGRSRLGGSGRVDRGGRSSRRAPPCRSPPSAPRSGVARRAPGPVTADAGSTPRSRVDGREPLAANEASRALESRSSSDNGTSVWRAARRARRRASAATSGAPASRPGRRASASLPSPRSTWRAITRVRRASRLGVIRGAAQKLGQERARGREGPLGQRLGLEPGQCFLPVLPRQQEGEAARPEAGGAIDPGDPPVGLVVVDAVGQGPASGAKRQADEPGQVVVLFGGTAALRRGQQAAEGLRHGVDLAVEAREQEQLASGRGPARSVARPGSEGRPRPRRGPGPRSRR